MKLIFYNRNYCIILVCVLIGVPIVWYGISRYQAQRPSSLILNKALEQNNLMPIVIIGSGCAGWSAAIYAARSGMKTLLIEGSKAGGQLVGTSYVENIPGVQKSMGQDIINTMAQQAKSFGALSLAQQVISVDMQQWPYTIKTDAQQEIKALSVIVATGAMPKRLNIVGEELYWGKGVTTCAICDAAFHKDHDVIVVGGGDSALEQVLQLSAYVKSITLLVRGSSLRASMAMQHHVLSNPKLTILYNTHLTAIKGNGSEVNKVLIDTKGQTKELVVQGVFLAIGHQPTTQLFKDQLKLDKEGYIITKNHTQHTSVEGVFAAGDVTDKIYRQAGVASGNGIKAALEALSFLQAKEFTAELQRTHASKFFDVTQKKSASIRIIQDIDEFDRMLENTHMPIVLDCYTTFCPACKTLDKILSPLSEEFVQKALFVKANVQNIAEIAERYAISSVPTLLILKKDQKPVRYQDSITNASHLHQFLNTHLS